MKINIMVKSAIPPMEIYVFDFIFPAYSGSMFAQLLRW